MMTKMMFGGLVVFASLTACTKTVHQCSKDSDCTNLAYPFCDVDGQYAASGGEHDICTIVPPDCPVERCGCQPGAATCVSGTLAVCNSDGQTTTSTACELGCSASNVTCQTFEPFFGTGVVLPDALVAADVTISSGSTIDSDTGNVRDSNNNAVPISHRLVAQGTGNDIQVFYAHALTIDDVRVTGTHPVSFVSAGPLLVRGKLDVGARSSLPGPGATLTGACAGKFGGDSGIGFVGGGAGNSTPGGSGDTILHNSGVPGPTGLPGDTETGFASLIGGCPGGSDGTSGGGGGGAIQLVSFANISIVGGVSVGGGGGNSQGGGGSGGNLVIEAPTVSVAGVVAANGGGGGACASLAADGGFGGSPALGPSCMGLHGGAGAAGTTAPGAGQPIKNGNSGGGPAGGGGALGRMLVRTAAGTFTPGSGSTISVASSVDTLNIH